MNRSRYVDDCTDCGGTGHKEYEDPRECVDCDGSGRQDCGLACDLCVGTGEDPFCRTCAGSGQALAVTETKVANEPLRRAYLELAADEKVDASKVARRLGWMDRGRPDQGRVRRALGLAEHQSKGGHKSLRKMISFDIAGAMCRAMGLDPIDVGI